jgi:hypothetical protein
MGKYGNRQVPPPERPWKVHPIWRGIGCLMLLIAPPVAFAAADMLVKMNMQARWLPMPPEMSRPYTIPEIGYTVDHALASLIVAAILLILGFAVMMIIYSIVYGMMGPPRYGPLDAEPIRKRR